MHGFSQKCTVLVWECIDLVRSMHYFVKGVHKSFKSGKHMVLVREGQRTRKVHSCKVVQEFSRGMPGSREVHGFNRGVHAFSWGVHGFKSGSAWF